MECKSSQQVVVTPGSKQSETQSAGCLWIEKLKQKANECWEYQKLEKGCCTARCFELHVVISWWQKSFFSLLNLVKGEAIELYIPTIFAASEGWDGAVALALAGWVICWLVQWLQWWGIDIKRWWCRKEFQTEPAFLECAKGRDTLM